MNERSSKPSNVAARDADGRLTWWQRGTIYHVYPRSFQDSDGDGVGDVGGVLERLDYLQWLGVDAVWLSPIYPSPMRDFGYDASDYTAIDPLFGTMETFDRLVEQLHARDMRILLDFVPNHTSSEHPWFRESRSSRDNPKRDWYIWRDPAPDGGPPNNWLSNAGGSAWTFDSATGQYYYHAFLEDQPDLNWRNPHVRAAMYGVLRFWLDRGVDNFRVDVIWHLMKDPEFRNDPVNEMWKPGDPPYHRVQPVRSADHPDVHLVVAEMRQVLEAYGPDRLLIGEIYLPLERLMAYYNHRLEGAHLPFNFTLISANWDAAHLAHSVAEYEASLPFGGWGNWVLGNHDQPRVASRIGRNQARAAMMLLLTLRGTPTIYYGDEIGMENVPVPPERERDPFGKNMPGLGRDPQRTPMQWDDGPNAGFTTGQPWLPLAPDWRTNNVAAQRRDPRSMLALTRALLHLRNREPVLEIGRYEPVGVADDVLLYARAHQGQRFLVALNLSPRPRTITLAEHPRGRIVLSTLLDREDAVDGHLELRGDEGVIVAVEPRR